MRLLPFISKRRPKRAELWGLKVLSDVVPPSLTPAEVAMHLVSMENKDTMAYKLTFDGCCGPLLQYGGNQTWGPLERELVPKDQRSIKTEISLPASCDPKALPCCEQVELKTRATPLDPEIFSQQASVHHDVELKAK